MGALGIKMARAMGEVGVITDQDVTRYIQAQTYFRGLGDAAKRKITSGVVSDPTINDMNEVIEKMKSGFGKKKVHLALNLNH